MHYLIGFNAEGKHPLGTLYTMRTDKKTIRGWIPRAKQMMKNNKKVIDVYVISEEQYNQSVCEMEPHDFESYVKGVGTLI